MDNIQIIAKKEAPFSLPGKEQKAMPDSEVVNWLEGLGRLPVNFDGNCLVPLLAHKKEKIRKLAAINLGKLSNMQRLASHPNEMK